MTGVDSEKLGWSRDEMARNAALDIPSGAYVNLGIGIPELIADHIPDDREVIFHTENGLLGMGPSPAPHLSDPELINAGKKRTSAVDGAAYFHHADSFAMIRGGHIDVCVLGAMQVAENGDLANWSTGPDDPMPAVGGAMDLVAGAKSIWIVTRHRTKRGEPKLLSDCTLPVTGLGIVERIYTDLATIEVTKSGFELKELAPNTSLERVQELTGARLLNRCADDEGQIRAQSVSDRTSPWQPE